ncbi:hypothetical protein XELAEV_18031872mg [Xenopus laevis]|uniref:Uncharacterized protein n=1 Tax=Xenopus laevis TaxID=8355 RepID=A0A974CQ24_XENLA|nr:hypothetical protein XELAEV_18031872mg [Xenopus laevis]
MPHRVLPCQSGFDAKYLLTHLRAHFINDMQMKLNGRGMHSLISKLPMNFLYLVDWKMYGELTSGRARYILHIADEQLC